MADDHVELSARSWRASALPQSLDFPPPYADRSTDSAGYAYWWQLMKLVFDLPNPHLFPPLSGFTVPETRTLRRYVATCQELAESTVLSHRSGIAVSFEGGRESVEVNLPTMESIRGTTVLFRQVASPEEAAGYSTVRKIIDRHIQEQADEHRDQRREWQKRWNGAQGRLRASLLPTLADQKAIELQGWSPDVPIPGVDTKPEEVLALFQYGELIHWGKQAEAMEALAKDPFWLQWQTMEFLTVLTQLSHFNLGYSARIRR